MDIRLLIVTARSASRVQFAGNGVRDVGELLFLLVEVFRCGGCGVLFEPFGGFFDGVEDLFRSR